MSHHHHHHHHHHHGSSSPREFTYDEKSNRRQHIIGFVMLAIGATGLILSIFGFTDVLTYDIAIPFLIIGVIFSVLGLQFVVFAHSDKKKATEMLKCSDCGTYNNKDCKVCSKCGKAFVPDTSEDGESSSESSE